MAQDVLRTATATIASGASLSGAVNLESLALLRINMPAAWTAASLTFQVSDDGSTYRNLYDNVGNEYTVTADASRAIIMTPADFAAIRYLKIRSGTSGAAVNQGAARTITLVVRPL